MNQNQINITFPNTSTEQPPPKSFDPIAALTPQNLQHVRSPPSKPTQMISNIDTLTETSEEKPRVNVSPQLSIKPTQVISNIDTLTETSEEKPKKTFRSSETPEPTASEKKNGSYKRYLKYKLKYLYALKEFYNTNI